jgi:hypothetical protein
MAFRTTTVITAPMVVVTIEVIERVVDGIDANSALARSRRCGADDPKDDVPENAHALIAERRSQPGSRRCPGRSMQSGSP